MSFAWQFREQISLIVDGQKMIKDEDVGTVVGTRCSGDARTEEGNKQDVRCPVGQVKQ